MEAPWTNPQGFRRKKKGKQFQDGLLVVPVVVDEAAVGDNLALGIGQRADRALKLGDGSVVLHGVSGDVVVLFQDCLAETGDEDVIRTGSCPS